MHIHTVRPDGGIARRISLRDIERYRPKPEDAENCIEGCRVYVAKSAPVSIGKTLWRIVSYRYTDHEGKERVIMDYEWVRPDPFFGMPRFWRTCEKFPGYNPHDGQYAGLPKGLVRLYRSAEGARVLATLRGASS